MKALLYPAVPSPSTSRGFSLVEMLMVVGSISAFLGIGVLAVSKTRQAGQEGKLDSDIATLNRSVQIYLGNGGNLPAVATSSEILTRLKMKVAAGDASSIVGHAGPFLDPRVTGVLVSNKGPVRAVWNGTTKRFVAATTGDGFAAFGFDDKLGTQAIQTESRQTAEKFAKRDSWVWDYEGDATAAPKVIPNDAGIASATPVAFAPENLPPAPGRLQPPQFSLAAGLYPYEKFPMPIKLINPNPKGSSQIYYSLNNGRWHVYTPGSHLKLPQDQFNTTLQAYSAPINGEEWVDSPSATNLYQTIFFRGATSGVFESPVGDARLVSNLTKDLKLSHFNWGTPVVGQISPNSLDFAGVSSFFALPEQEFKIGDLSYSNSTTASGTNATSVQMEIRLDLTVPASTEQLDFTLKLLSTPNGGRDADKDADYVWIPALSSKFSATVQGQTFYLQLRFGKSDVDSFTTIDEFHVHENKQATGAVYGKLTTKPVF